MNYNKYVKSAAWTEKSKRIRDHRGRCANCSRLHQLHVHHNTYRNLGSEIGEDVTVLCRWCHKLFHDNYIYDGRTHTFAPK